MRARGLIRDLETTTASVHDSRADLSREGEVVYRDKGYFGVARAAGHPGGETIAWAMEVLPET